MELKQHPLSAAFPSMNDADFLALKDDIENNGQREPIWILDGMVLDGWHRYRACAELGLKPKQFNFGDGDPVEYVISHNLHRRHLTASQRAAAVVACAQWAPPHRTKKVEPGSTFSTNGAMAKAAGTTVRTITDAKVAHKAGLGEAVKEGAVTAKEGAKIARGTPAPAPKPAAASPASAAPAHAPAEDDGPDESELAAQAAAEEADRLALQKLLDSDDKLATAVAEVKRLNAVNAALQSSLNGQMAKNNELIRQIKALQRKLDKVPA